MPEIVISVENLSKRYLIGHQSAEREQYMALRDIIGREARNFVRKATDLVRGRQIVQGDAVEDLWALKNVSFEVRQGDVIGIVGRNGAGKSTLLKILSRITEPTEGRVRLRGRVGSLLEVGTGFHPELSGRENIYLNGAILGMKRAEIDHKFDEIVAFAEIDKFVDTPVKRYSSGMYVRLAFAVAAHLEPDILVVDEVLAVGDVAFQKKCLGKIQDVAATQGRTVLFVSHNMAAVESMCSHSLLLVDGHCVAQGDTSAIIQDYLRALSKLSGTPLQERTDRQGSGDLRFVSMTLEDSAGNPISNVQCGGCATFHFRLENRTEHELRNIQISLGIDTEIGQRVTLWDTELINSPILSLGPGETSVRVIVSRFPLNEGRYSLTMFSTVNGIVSDWIKQGAFFDVEAGNYYGTGRLPPPGQSLFLTDFQFIVDTSNRVDYRPLRMSETI
jgi:lipopolysaccharide transport system ATP-binding protein